MSTLSRLALSFIIQERLYLRRYYGVYCRVTYCITTNIGKELAKFGKLPCDRQILNLANIFVTISLMTLGVDIGLTNHSFHNKSLIFITQYNHLLKFSVK